MTPTLAEQLDALEQLAAPHENHRALRHDPLVDAAVQTYLAHGKACGKRARQQAAIDHALAVGARVLVLGPNGRREVLEP